MAALGDAVPAEFAASEQGCVLAEWRQEQQDLAAEESAQSAVLRTPDGKTLAAERARLGPAASRLRPSE